MTLASWLVQHWYGAQRPVWALRMLEHVYLAALRIRRPAAPAYRAPVPVVVVGNLSVGGTGKTPLILWLYAYCQSLGLRVGVVSRGYGARPPQYPWRVLPTQNARVAGDEPLMLARRGVDPLFIDPDRPAAVRALLAAAPVDLILSDDGLQHAALGRDLELVVVDHQRLWGNGHCLPAGPLREPLTRLQRVDAVLVNGGGREDWPLGFRLRPGALINLRSGVQRDPAVAVGSCHAVAGIGHPQRFFDTLRELGWQPVEHAFADHARYRAEQLELQPPLPVLMTEKDAVKCASFAREDWWYLSVDAEPDMAFVDWFRARLGALGLLD